MKVSFVALTGFLISQSIQNASALAPTYTTLNQIQKTSLYAATAIEAVSVDEVVAAAAPDDNENDNDENESVEFPPPLNKVDRLKRAATFWSTALPIVANYYGLIGSITFQELLGDTKAEEEIEVREKKKIFGFLVGFFGDCRH